MAASHASDSRRFIGKGPRTGRDCRVERLRAGIVAIAGRRCGKNPALSGVCSRLEGRIYQELCPGVLRSGCKALKSGRVNDPVRYPCHRAGEPAARLAAAMGRRRHLCAVSAGRKPAADRSRHDVADHGRAVDHRSPRRAGNRRLFLHHARPALDLDAVAGAGALCQGLCHLRLERPGGAGGRRDSRHLRAAGKIPEPPFERKRDAGVHRRGAGADGAASAGAAACAGAAGHGGVGRRHDRGGGPAPRAVVLAAAADGAVGQSAWRLCLRPGADRADRARCGGERGGALAHDRWSCAGRRSASRRC